MAVKICNFCGSEIDSKNKDVVLFKSSNGNDMRICSDCVKKCNEIYLNKMAKKKQEEISKVRLDMTPIKVKEKLDEWILDQDIAMKKIAREYYNHLKRIKRYDADNECNNKLRIDKSNMIYMGPTGCGKIA